MTFTEFMTKWENEIYPNRPIVLRKGQSLMIYLNEVWPQEFERITSVHYYDWNENYDSFFTDKYLPNTVKHLENVWKNYPN